ncbi:MAG: ATP-dependent Clp protease ATP-binding subunit [Patescibacteria group bacterium]
MEEITSKFTQHLKEALAKSLALVVESKQQTVEPIHLLWALAQQTDSIASQLLTQVGVKKEQLEKFVKLQVVGQEPRTPIPNLSEETKIILEKAVITAATHQHKFISTEHLLFGLLQMRTEDVLEFFQKESVDYYSLQSQLKQALALTVQIPLSIPSQQEDFFAEQDDILDQEHALDYFTKNLTDNEYQKKQIPIIGRDKEINRICTILGRKTKNNPVLVGDPGVGKSAIVEGLAQRILANKIPTLKNHKIYALNLASLLAGTMYRGSFEARLQELIDEIKQDPKSILFIDELHTIVGSGANTGTLDVANILKPALARGEIKCIGATTFEEYKKWIESDGALERRFQKLLIEEPSKQETKSILCGIKNAFGSHHHLNYPDAILDLILDLSDSQFPNKRFPDKAIDLMDEVGSYAKFHRSEIKKATQELVIETLCAITGAKQSDIKRQTKQLLQEIEKTLSDNIFGQQDVIKNVSHILKCARLGLKDGQKPMASFLFVGPSGVGKTELAKQIAKAFFHGPRPILRLDMSEYKEAFNASKLLGSPAGYIGYKDANVLADHIRNYPRSVILFDEIEKAHPDIHNLLLQILEEGTLRDATGRELSFQHAVIILTSNAGQELFAKGRIGFGSNNQVSETEIRASLEDVLRGELLNRIERICQFNILSTDTLRQIAKQKLKSLAQKAQKNNLDVIFDDAIINIIAENSSKKHGARGIDQQINQKIEPIIINALLHPKTGKKIKIKVNNKGNFSILPKK